MIEPQSLRIGNYFQWSQFASMGKGIDQITHGQQISDYVDFKDPIPLSPEWLERMGFEGNINDGFGLDVIELNYITTEDHFQFEFKPASASKLTAWFLVDLKYVHQLQNLFHSLTGQELTIKP